MAGTTQQRTEPVHSVGFIGAGNMASALIRGIIAAELYPAEQIWVSDVDGRQRARLRRRFGIGGTADNRALVEGSKVVILAVKPQILDAVMAEIAPVMTKKHLCISIVAGVTLDRLERGLGGTAKVLRVMPNTPAVLGKGMAALVRGQYARATDERLGRRLFQAVGEAVVVPKEAMLDAVTGLSGSGPAYVYRFAEGLIAGGEAVGLPTPLATQLALQTLAGAAAMLQETGETPEALRAQVTSPGGTTLAGLTTLEKKKFKEAIIAGVQAATQRSQELGGSRVKKSRKK